MISRHQAGFTAVELLITLFVAAAFLIAAYQLFNIVVKDGGQARAEAKASNVAYDYMRRYSAQVTDPCVESTIVSDTPVTVDELTNVLVSATISCPGYSVNSMSKLEVVVKYNNPQQILRFATYVNGNSAQPDDITNGLIGWWKMNGNANSSVGDANGVTFNGTALTTGANGQPNSAYLLDGTDDYLRLPAGFLPSTMSEITISVWARIPAAKTTSIIQAITDDANNRLNIHLPWSDGVIYWDFGVATAGVGRVTATFNSAWYNTWSLWTFTVSNSTDGMKIYRNGTQISTSGTYHSTFTPGTKTLDMGISTGASYFAGAIDDLRIYNRPLSSAEITALYNRGAQ